MYLILGFLEAFIQQTVTHQWAPRPTCFCAQAADLVHVYILSPPMNTRIRPQTSPGSRGQPRENSGRLVFAAIYIVLGTFARKMTAQKWPQPAPKPPAPKPPVAPMPWESPGTPWGALGSSGTPWGALGDPGGALGDSGGALGDSGGALGDPGGALGHPLGGAGRVNYIHKLPMNRPSGR